MYPLDHVAVKHLFPFLSFNLLSLAKIIESDGHKMVILQQQGDIFMYGHSFQHNA